MKHREKAVKETEKKKQRRESEYGEMTEVKKVKF